MKRIWIILLFPVVSVCNGQNLIPNPRFEQYSTCPEGLNEFNDCANWRNFGNSPDYFDTCATGITNVPNAAFGFQYGHAGGTAFAGIATYFIPQEFPDYRELVGVQLTEQLQIGQKYFVSFFVSRAASPTEAVGTNKMGCKFSTVAFDSCCPPPIDNFANIYSDSIITDSLHWTEISGSFVADSAYSYFIIGNFFDDSHTDTVHLSQHNGAGYYYVTDVAVSTDSLYTETWTGLSKQLNVNNDVTVYPNPTSGEVNIVSGSLIKSIQITNLLGQIIYSDNDLNTFQYHLSMVNLEPGIYYLSTKTRTSFEESIINLIH